MNNNELSLIICAYKDSPYLEECIKSLLNQEMKCSVSISTSTPSTFINNLAKKYGVNLYVNKKSNGYYDDFLFAYNKAETKYVTLCHQDDVYLSNFSKEILKRTRNNKDILILFSNYYDYKNDEIIKHSKLLFVKRAMNFLLKFKIFQNSKFIRRRILSFGNSICSPTVTFNKEKIKEPVVKCPLATSHDWYTWVDFSSKKGKFVYISNPILLRRINELSETTLVIENNTKKESDYEIFKMFWPTKIAKIISKIYSVSEKNNIIDNNKGVLIVDDVFPIKNSAFRYQEFTSILNEIPDSSVLSTFESIRYSGNFSPKKVIEDYTNEYHKLSKKILRKLPNDINKYKLLYCTFLFNAYNYLVPISEKYKIPFIFTLYPGGRFALNNSKSDKMLQRVFSSKYFKKVIVTQNVTYEYLVSKKLCDKDKIECIYGGIVLKDKLNVDIDKKMYYKINKETLDICFVAYKYSSKGEDKGFDIFIELAKKMSKYNNIKFHVVGNFDENLISTKNLTNIRFYGTRPQEWFKAFYKKMDVILSPNVGGKIRNGCFDGFPTTCAMEASLNGVAIFCTDSLGQNAGKYKEKEEIIILKNTNIDYIYNKIKFYYENPEKLKELSINGYKKSNKLFSHDQQIGKRISLLNDNLKDKKSFEKRKSNFNLIMNTKIKIRYYFNTLYGFLNKLIHGGK